MHILRLLTLAGAGALFALAAEAGPFTGIHDTYSGMDLKAEGIEFDNVLYAGYVKLSRDRRAGWDLRDAELFNHKARTAARRSAIQPDSIDDRKLAEADAKDLYQALGRLYRVFDRGGRMLAPTETANAQVSFDCWIEAAEAGRRADIDRCKSASSDALAAAEAKATIDPFRQVVPARLGTVEPTNYLVFFDFDKSDLTAASRTIIQNAANAFRSGNRTRITATGHADRAGPDAYNQRLSERRAAAVRDELVRLGVPANVITISGRGESQNLVPTADGAREPQNRRVEIVI
jgi:OOP family OmpA-OmpF porin